MLHPDGFRFLMLPILLNCKAHTERLVAPITGCLSFFTIPLFLYEASLPPLRVTRTHFALSLYERTLCHPTSFPISGLVGLGVKPRLCRSSWRAFASTHPLTLSPISPRKVLLACPFEAFLGICLPSLWSPPFSAPCSRCDSLLSHQGAALAHPDSLPFYDLVISADGSVSLPFGKGGSGVLANCFLCGTEATLSFSAGPLCSSFSTEACAILHALCWSRQQEQVCHFSSLLLLFESRSVLFSVFFLTLIPLADVARTVFFAL